MIDGLSLLNYKLWLPVLIGAMVLFVGLVWKEWLDRGRGRFLANSTIVFITISALAFIVLEPARQVEINDRQGIILSENFDERQKDSLLSIYKGIKELIYNPKKSVQKDLDSLTSVFIVGNGIKPFDFWQFKGVPSAYIPAIKPSGITKLKFSKTLISGGKLHVNGVYHKPIKGTFLVLQDAGGNGLDSVQLESKEDVGFLLDTNPKVAGNFTYSVTEKDSTGEVLKSDALPVIIRDKMPLRLLILNNYPTFETKYLKNFLADNGHEVIVRSQLTKGTYKFEYFNTTSIPIYQITDKILKDFDLVIVDADTFLSFGTAFKNRLEKNIREQGLGLFLQPTDFMFGRRDNQSYFNFKRDNSREIQLLNSNSIMEKYPYSIDALFSVQPINLGTIATVAAFKQLGLGRISTTMIQNSYQLLLDGEEQSYQSLWTQLLDPTAKTKMTQVEWEAQTILPKLDEPFHFTIHTNLDDFKIMDSDSSVIGMLENPQIPTRYSGTTYPNKTGWNELRIENDSTSNFPFYVLDDSSWKSLHIAQNIAANKKEFKSDLNIERTVLVDRPISPIIFYILFLLGMGWLWLSPKLFAN